MNFVKSKFVHTVLDWLKKYWKLVVIFIITLLAYGQSTKMFFWVDDFGLTYKMVFPYDAPNPSNFGGGLWGTGAYRHNATPFIFLYPLFGLSAPVYFTLGVLQYFITACFLYLFVKSITKNKSISFISAVIFGNIPLPVKIDIKTTSIQNQSLDEIN